MTDVKRLLAEATPLPWHSWRSRYVNGSADAALAVYAVNHLPDYLAAVEALERLTEDGLRLLRVAIAADGTTAVFDAFDEVYGEAARAALARLRDEVPV